MMNNTFVFFFCFVCMYVIAKLTRYYNDSFVCVFFLFCFFLSIFLKRNWKQFIIFIIFPLSSIYVHIKNLTFQDVVVFIVISKSMREIKYSNKILFFFSPCFLIKCHLNISIFLWCVTTWHLFKKKKTKKKRRRRRIK